MGIKILKFGAQWCPSCLIMKPRWEEIEQSIPELETEYYDYDTEKEMVERYNVNHTLPTVIFLDRYGQEFLRLYGEQDKDKLLQIIKENINK